MKLISYFLLALAMSTAQANENFASPQTCGLQVLGASIVGFLLGVGYTQKSDSICLPSSQQEAFEKTFQAFVQNPSPIKVNGEGSPYNVEDASTFLARVFPCK